MVEANEPPPEPPVPEPEDDKADEIPEPPKVPVSKTGDAWTLGRHTLICGDSADVLRGMEESTFDSVLTDPPYGLEFMGKGWDSVLPDVAIWAESLRVCKPGAMMVAFAGTLMAQHNLFIDPGGAFGVDRSVEMVLGAIFGGIGTLWGPVAGGIAIVVIGESANNALRDIFAGADAIVYGVVLVAVALWLPGGLASIPRLFKKKKKKQAVGNDLKLKNDAKDGVTTK